MANLVDELNRKTNGNGIVSTISQLPQDLPAETLVAAAIYTPQSTATTTQTTTPSTQTVRNAATARLNQSGVQTGNLGNFTPISFPALDQINRRLNGIPTVPSPRDVIVRGINPKTKKLVQDIEDLQAINRLQQRLAIITQDLENKINALTKIYETFVNTPDLAAAAALTTLINKLDDLERAYTAAKRVAELLIRTAQNIRNSIIRAVTNDIPRALRITRGGLDALTRILKLPERPRIVLYPKLPKLPRLNFSKADFVAKFKKAAAALKKKDSEFYQKSYNMAIQQAGFEIVDPEKDKIQQALTRARNSLRQARAQFQANAAARSASIQFRKDQIFNAVRKVNDAVEREKLRIQEEFKKRRDALRAQGLDDIGARRQYLTAEEISTLVVSSRINIAERNILDDFPATKTFTNNNIDFSSINNRDDLARALAVSVTELALVTPDGRTVFKDRRNQKLYVLQSARERIQDAVNRATNTVRNNVNQAQNAVNTVNSALGEINSVTSRLNSNALRQEFRANLASELANTTNIANQTRQESTAVENQENPSAQANANIIFENDTYSINADANSVTTTTRRLQPAAAVNQATTYNRDIAARNGYTVPISTRPSGPRSVNVNGQVVYELVLTIRYRDFKPPT